MKKYDVAVIGASGLVGQKVIDILYGRGFPLDKLYLFAGSETAGTQLYIGGKIYTVKQMDINNFPSCHFVFMCVSNNLSAIYSPILADKGCIVIDNSSRWRMENSVPLIVPEINADELKGEKLIANPNCSTVQLVNAIYPIWKKYGIKRIVVSTYQSVSGAGYDGLNDLLYSKNKPKAFRRPIISNLIPQIDDFDESGYSLEELKVMRETNKIMHSKIAITATAVRVPVYYAHGESVNLELIGDYDISELIGTMKDFKNLIVSDDDEHYFTNIDAVGRDEVFVSRIRRDESVKNGLNMWIIADNVRKGAATNAVQIAETIIKEKERLYGLI